LSLLAAAHSHKMSTGLRKEAPTQVPDCSLVHLIGKLVYERRFARTTQHEIRRPTSPSPVGIKIFFKPYFKLYMLTSAQNKSLSHVVANWTHDELCLLHWHYTTQTDT